jgi:Ca2+/Na+ antiporter
MEQPGSVNKTPSQIHLGHISVIAMCAFALIFFTYLKSGFKLNLFTASKNESVKVLTYEEALKLAQAEIEGSASGSEVDNLKNTNQIAMLDPLSKEGQVLGVSTDDESIFPSADEFLTPEILNEIKLTFLPVSDTETVAQYKRDLHTIESNNSAEEILAALSNDDKTALKNVEPKVKQLVVELYAMPVPKAVELYHKIKMIYYLNLSQLALGYSGDTTVADPKDVSIEIFALIEKMKRLTQDIQNKYGIEL